MEIKKNDFLEVEILDIGINGEGIAKIDNFPIFINGAITGEFVKIKILKVNKNFAYGKLIEIIKKSEKRIEPICEHFGACGGCSLLHIDYDYQLDIKTNFIKSNLKKIANLDFNVERAMGMKNPLAYRNKASFPISYQDNLKIGFYKPRSHNIVNIENCIIQSPINEPIIAKLRKFIEINNISVYDEKTGKGILRHIITRVGNKTGEVMVCLVINAKSFAYENELVLALKDIENIATIVLNFNTKNTNVILGDKTKTIYGKGYITDYIKDLKFNISPLSFYQINQVQTEILYKTALDYCQLSKDEIVFDAYCGIGTISLFLAKECKMVYGIEIIEDAIENAKQNAKENKIENAKFLVGKSEEVIPNLIFKEGIVPDTIVVDPPRKGCDKALLDAIGKTEVKKLVYVSCDNSTLARDIAYLKQYGFRLEKLQPVDMFCMTCHIECVAQLKR